jgi:hypothetical protein
MGFPSFLTKIMDGMKFIDHWIFARTDRRTDGRQGVEHYMPEIFSGL